jgi:hypothetical protein
MKKKILVLAGIAAMFASGSNAYAVTGSSTATIGTAIGISENQLSPTGGDLAFGHIIPSTGGTVIITPAGVVTTTGALTLTTQLTKGPAEFNVTGDAGKTYNVTFDASTTISNGTTTMAVTGLNHDSGLALDINGVSVFHVGGTLTVASAQATGSYLGTFNISAAYN